MKLKALAGSVLWFMILPTPALAVQVTAQESLAGVDSVDARVLLTWDQDIPRLDEATTESRLQTLLELELRKHGIPISVDAPNYLLVGMTLLHNDVGTVAYAYQIELHEFGRSSRAQTRLMLGAWSAVDVDGWTQLNAADTARAGLELRAALWSGYLAALDSIKTEWVITWQDGLTVVHVGVSNLLDSLERAVTGAAQVFVNRYLASN